MVLRRRTRLPLLNLSWALLFRPILPPISGVNECLLRSSQCSPLPLQFDVGLHLEQHVLGNTRIDHLGV